MPNIQVLLKAEIARVARKELRAELAPLQKASAGYRRQLSALKQQLASLEREVRRQARGGRAKPRVADSAEDSPLRFSAKGVKRHRERLGLSAAQAGQLLGVSALSIYKWESGKTRPRAAQIEKLAQLRAMGKREASAKLEALAVARPSGNSRARA